MALKRRARRTPAGPNEKVMMGRANKGQEPTDMPERRPFSLGWRVGKRRKVERKVERRVRRRGERRAAVVWKRGRGGRMWEVNVW